MLTRRILLALVCAGCAHAAGLTFVLSPTGGALTGSAGSIVGWGFTLTESTASQWDLISSASFVPGSTLGTFTPFDFPLIIGSGPGNTNPYTEGFVNSNNLANATGVGRFAISASAKPGDLAAGPLTLTYAAYNRDPLNDPAFDPAADFLFNASVSANASVLVVGTPIATPEPRNLLLTVVGLFVLLLFLRTRDRSYREVGSASSRRLASWPAPHSTQKRSRSPLQRSKCAPALGSYKPRLLLTAN